MQTNGCRHPAFSRSAFMLPQAAHPRRFFVHARAAVAERPAPLLALPKLEVPRGETAGAALVLEGVTVQAGDRDLLTDVDWRLMPGQRVGLVGSNGCGKSTLLKCLSGYRQVDAGKMIVGHKIEMGYLEQTAVSGSERTVWDEARSRMTELLVAEHAMEVATEAMMQGLPKAADQLSDAQEAFEAAGGYDADKRIANVLTGLGFRQEQFYKPCSDFSGGWQMRIALARLLLGPAGQGATSGSTGGLLLLDEPTNHLDSAACKWLGNFLRNSTGSIVLVSHDEALLEDACDRIVEVRGKKLHHYVGGFSRFMEQRTEREAQARATAEAQQAEIARLEEFVARFGAKASKASQAQSRAKQLEKLRDSAVEIPAASAALGAGDYKKVHLKLPKAPPCHTESIIMKKANIGWGTPAPGEQPLLKDIDLVVKRGQRILVLGPNGAGKSTLLKAISGSIQLWGGERKLGEGVKLAVFSQDLAQDLPLEMPALDYVMEKARAEDPTMTMEKCRQSLGALGLTGTMALQKIGILSGGEKARVALAAFALVPCNVLLLDEASNHLDAQTIDVLTGALQQFEGAMLAITHNQAFATSLNATHILRVDNGGAKLTTNTGLSDADFEHTPLPIKNVAKKVEPPPKAAKGSAKANGKASSNGNGNGKVVAAAPAPAPTPTSTKKRTTLSFSEQTEYKKLVAELPKLTAKRDALAAQVASGNGGFKAAEAAAKELAFVSDEVDAKEARWLELAEIVGDI